MRGFFDGEFRPPALKGVAVVYTKVWTFIVRCVGAVLRKVIGKNI